MAQVLQANITEKGLNQGDLVKVLANLVDVVNELQTDHATFKAVVDDNKTAVNAIITAAATNIGAVAAVDAVATSSPATLTNTTALKLTKG
tara:strand:- start:116 stop:388 length:273 start_codon:yes stop_codon:yes gene_type:complete